MTTWRHYLPPNADALDIALTIEKHIADESKWKAALEWVREFRPAEYEVAADYLRGMFQRRKVAREARARSGRQAA